MTIFVVNGYPGSGKTSFENIVKADYGPLCKIISTVDYVKSCAKAYFNWDGNKTPQARKMLSDLKDIMTEYDDIPFKKVCEAIESYKEYIEDMVADTDDLIFFIDSREPAEIERFKQELGAKTVYIQRLEAENKPTSNSSDANVKNYTYDYYIDNNGSLRDLEMTADKFMRGFINFDKTKKL